MLPTRCERRNAQRPGASSAAGEAIDAVGEVIRREFALLGWDEGGLGAPPSSCLGGRRGPLLRMPARRVVGGSSARWCPGRGRALCPRPPQPPLGTEPRRLKQAGRV